MEAKVFPDDDDDELDSSIFPDRELSPAECSRLVGPAFNRENEAEKVGGRVDKGLVLRVEAKVGGEEEEDGKVGKGSIMEFARDSLDDSSVPS